MTDKTATSPLGAVVREGDGYRLEFVRTFPDPIDRVWAAMTDSDELQGWYGTWTGDPSTGEVEVTFNEAPDNPGPVTIEECQAPRLLAVVVPSPDGPWPLRIELESIEGGTRLTFNHRLAEPFDASYIGPGWQYYLDRVTAHLNGTPIPSDWDAYGPLSTQYPLPT